MSVYQHHHDASHLPATLSAHVPYQPIVGHVSYGLVIVTIVWSLTETGAEFKHMNTILEINHPLFERVQLRTTSDE